MSRRFIGVSAGLHVIGTVLLWVFAMQTASLYDKNVKNNVQGVYCKKADGITTAVKTTLYLGSTEVITVPDKATGDALKPGDAAAVTKAGTHVTVRPIVASPGRSETQKVFCVGEKGTFTLTAHGKTTAALGFGATDTGVRDAIRGLSTTSDDATTVTFSSGSAACSKEGVTWTVTFKDTFGDVPPITADTSALGVETATLGVVPRITVTEVQKGDVARANPEDRNLKCTKQITNAGTGDLKNVEHSTCDQEICSTKGTITYFETSSSEEAEPKKKYLNLKEEDNLTTKTIYNTCRDQIRGYADEKEWLGMWHAALIVSVLISLVEVYRYKSNGEGYLRGKNKSGVLFGVSVIMLISHVVALAGMIMALDRVFPHSLNEFANGCGEKDGFNVVCIFAGVVLFGLGTVFQLVAIFNYDNRIYPEIQSGNTQTGSARYTNPLNYVVSGVGVMLTLMIIGVILFTDKEYCSSSTVTPYVFIMGLHALAFGMSYRGASKNGTVSSDTVVLLFATLCTTYFYFGNYEGDFRGSYKPSVSCYHFSEDWATALFYAHVIWVGMAIVASVYYGTDLSGNNKPRMWDSGFTLQDTNRKGYLDREPTDMKASDRLTSDVKSKSKRGGDEAGIQFV